MNPTQAQELAVELIIEHIPGWGFRWNRAMTIAGQCSHRDTVIILSKPLVEISDDDAIRDTILHEIAHALAGPQHDHDAVWRRHARALGAPTSTTIHESRVGNPRQNLAPWVGTCPAGHVSTARYFRKPRARYSCSQCSDRWSAEHLLEYRREF